MNTWFKRSSLAVLLGGALLTQALAAAALKPGDAFPALKDFGLTGEIPEVKGKVVLVDFFASWCEPCKESFPVMQELHQSYGGKGLVILAVNVDKKAEDMQEFLKKHPVGFAVVRDAASKLVSAVKISTMPSSFLIDREGKVHSLHRGFKGDQTRREYVEAIESLLR